MSTTFIYALCDPDTGEVRYVGKSSNPVKRLHKHLVDPWVCRRTKWLKSLAAQNLIPGLEIIDEVLETEWPMIEVAYIQFFREAGFDLVNGNDGGEGGHNPSAETREKLRSGRLGKKHTAEACENISLGHLGQIPHNLGKVTPAEVRLKQRAARLGRKFSPLSAEHRAKIGEANRGRKRTPEQNQANRLRQMGCTATEEARANMSAAQKLRWAKKKGLI